MSKLFMLFAAAWLVSAQTPNPEPRPKLPREIQDLVDQAPAAPPELAADILLRLVEAGKIPDRKIKTGMLEQAFTLAGSARYPMKMVIAFRGGRTDSDAGVLYAALSNGLDALSLRCRVIRAMLNIDQKRALELFQSMPPLRFPPRGCSDAMADRVDEIYSTLTTMVDGAFDAGQKREGKHLELAESYVRGMIAPAQLEPAAKMILALSLDQKHLAPMLGAYSVALREVSADNRTFTSSTNSSLMRALIQLATTSEAKGVSSFGLVDAFRVYFVKHMRAAQCEDNADPKGLAEIRRIAESFNSNLGPIADPEGKQVKPLQTEDMATGKVEGHAKVYNFWSKPQTEQLLMDLKHLRFGTPEQIEANNKMPRPASGLAPFLSVEQRGEVSWQREASDYLNEVEGWKKDHDETEENYFHEICFIYTPLLELVPQGQLWDSVLQSFAGFLGRSGVKKDSPPEWYFELSHLMKLPDAGAATNVKVSETIKARGDLVMSMYVELERLTGGGRAK